MNERSGQIIAFAVCLLVLVAITFAAVTMEAEPVIEWKRRCIETASIVKLAPQIREEFYCLNYEMVCLSGGETIKCPEGQP